MFRYTNLKVTFGFTIISSIAATTLKLLTKLGRISFDIFPLNADLELNLFLILETTFKLTQERISRIVFSKVDLAESDSFPK